MRRSAAIELLVLLVAPATSTFLQWSLCDDSRGSGTIPFGLNARLVKTPGDSATSRLVLNLARHQSGITCRETPGVTAIDQNAWPEAMVQLYWNGLRRLESFSSKTRARLDCEDFIGDHRPAYLPVNSSRVSMVLLDDDIGELPALSTLHFQAHLESPIFADAQCIASLMTPAIPPAFSLGLRYGPLAVFLFVFFVSVLRTIAAASEPQYQNHDEDDTNGSTLAAEPVLLPAVSDCLHFLQFIFLTSGLSLSYPGFYPAAAGHLNWFALFANLALPIKSFFPAPTAELVRMASTYPGVSDGLYEVNGTYGGSLGLEVMTQMVGAPMTCDTWLLMVLFTACIATALGLFLWLLETVRPRNVLGLPLLSVGAGTGRWGPVTRIGHGVLRLVLSYITLPLVALSTYQLNFSGDLGAGHMTLALVVLLLILLTFACLTVRLPATSLGALVLEARHRYRRVGGDEVNAGNDVDEERQARRDHGFVMALFVLNIIRGLTIGGLQKWGVVQLVVLLACEVTMLLAVWMFRPYPLLSSGFATILLRLAVLVCFAPFVFPPSKMLSLKSVFAYVALSLTVAGLLVTFFVPSCWHLCRLATQGAKRFHDRGIRKDAPVFGLRQLQRREAPGPQQADDLTSTARPPLHANENLKTLRERRSIDDGWNPRRDVWPPYGSLQSDAALTSRFYRPPRSPVPTATGEPSRLSGEYSPDSRLSSPLPPLTPYLAERRLASQEWSVDFSSPCPSPTADIQSAIDWDAKESSGSAFESSDAESSRPLGPRWDDYSFREADLFYTAPPPPQAAATMSPLDASGSSSRVRKAPSSWSILSGWSISGMKSTAPEERGFSVVRPSRAPSSTGLQQR